MQLNGSQLRQVPPLGTALAFSLTGDSSMGPVLPSQIQVVGI
jgi:hypothetical protein